MIKYVKHEFIDKNKWDKSINSSVNAYIYADSSLLDILTDNSWDALIKDDYEILMPLPYSKKFDFKYIHQPLFIQQLGIFWKNTASNSVLEEFIDAIPNEFKFISLNLNKFLLGKISTKFLSSINDNFELEISGNYKIIYESYSSNLKRNLKKAEANNLNEIQYVKPEELIKMFRENKGKEIKKLKSKDYNRLQKLIYMLIHKGKAEVKGVIDEHNNIVATALFVSGNGRSIFLFSGNTKEGKKLGAMPYLIDNQIKKLQNQNYILDFEGSNDVNLARFYKSFGAKKFHYESIEINRFKFPLKQIKRIYSYLKA